MVTVYAENLKDGTIIELGEFSTREEAEWNIENNLDYDEEDIIEDWNIFTIEEFEMNDFDEMGFDPYAGCYTEDCQHEKNKDFRIIQ